MAILKTDAIVLRTIDFSETSLVVWTFTRTHGRVHVIAKGARRARSAFEGALEPLVRGELVFYRKAKPEGLDTAKEFDPHDLHLGLRTDLARLHRGVYVGELLLELSEPDVPAPDAFDAAVLALAALARDPLPGLEQTLVRFMLRLLRSAGLAPVLDRCARCQGPVFAEGVDDAWFAPGQGGVACLAHGDGEAGTSGVSRALLRRLLATALGRALAPDPAADALVRGLLDGFFTWHLGRELRAARWLRPLDLPRQSRAKRAPVRTRA